MLYVLPGDIWKGQEASLTLTHDPSAVSPHSWTVHPDEPEAGAGTRPSNTWSRTRQPQVGTSLLTQTTAQTAKPTWAQVLEGEGWWGGIGWPGWLITLVILL